MYRQPKALASYGRIANVESDPIKQIVMLYDGAIRFVNLSAADIEANDIVAKGEHTNRALDIINYLQGILDFEKGGNVSRDLDNLYRNATSIILRASAGLDAALMRRAAIILSNVREAWEINARTSTPKSSFDRPVSTETAGFALLG